MTDLQQCKGLTASGSQCGNASLGDSEYCYVHRAQHSDDISLTKKAKEDKLINVSDVLKLQSKVLTTMGRKSTFSSKELIAFSSLSQNYIKNFLEADKSKRIDKLEAVTKHLT